jgi:uncharacterized RDD family membrane protein YckC
MKNLFSTHHYDSSRLIHSHHLEGKELAGFTRRLVALAIDLLVLLLVLFALGKLLDMLGWINFGFSIGVSHENSDQVLPHVNNSLHINSPEYLKVIIKLLIPVLYFGIFTRVSNGYTLGKRICKIRIISTSHSHLTLWHAIERSLGYYASALEFGFGFLQYFIDYNRRTVHDRIAETIVIRVRK